MLPDHAEATMKRIAVLAEALSVTPSATACTSTFNAVHVEPL